MDYFLNSLFFVVNAYSTHPRDSVLIARYGAVRGAITFGGIGIFLVMAAIMIQSSSRDCTVLVQPICDLVGYILSGVWLASTFFLLACSGFFLRLIYTYTNPEAFSYR